MGQEPTSSRRDDVWIPHPADLGAVGWSDEAIRSFPPESRELLRADEGQVLE